MPLEQIPFESLVTGGADRAFLHGAGTRRKRLFSAVLASVVVTAAFAGSVHAQSWSSSNLHSPDASKALAYLADAHLLGAGLITAIGSAKTIADGELNRRWFVASTTFGVLNLLGSGFTAYVAANNPQDSQWAVLTALHGGIGLFGLVTAVVGFSSGRPSAPAALHLDPVVVGGTDAGGRRWTGAGIQVWGF